MNAKSKLYKGRSDERQRAVDVMIQQVFKAAEVFLPPPARPQPGTFSTASFTVPTALSQLTAVSGAETGLWRGGP